jgi:hypothetical protein
MITESRPYTNMLPQPCPIPPGAKHHLFIDYAQRFCVQESIALRFPLVTTKANMQAEGRHPVPSPQTISHNTPTFDGRAEVLVPSYMPSVREHTSLDISGRLERKLAQYNASTNVSKRWLLELMSVAISAICMGNWDPCYIRVFGR